MGHKFQLIKELLFSASDVITLRLSCLDFVFVTGPPKYSDLGSKDGYGDLLCASPFVSLSHSYHHQFYEWDLTDEAPEAQSRVVTYMR